MADEETPESGAPEATTPPPSNVRDLSLEEEMKASYLTYAMSVIVARALPDVRDGLKPSQRRILVAANDLNLSPRSRFLKCAKIAGDTSGNYHPHGEAVVYPTLVRLAQDFVMRQTLVAGQGNFGTVDGDPPAAMRYTEARLTGAAIDLLDDLELDTVDMAPNYDERLTEPTVLPSKFPNLLVNGANGIAVGMATSIPPHNPGEIARAIKAVINDPEIELPELMKIVPGPDFPTGAMICGRAGIRQAYATGRGKFRVRAVYEIEEKRGGREWIVFTEIPYLVNRTGIIEKIAALVKDDKIKGISDLRDESDREGSRLVVELKKGEDPQLVLNLLYKHTPLQDTCSAIMIALVDGRPQTLPIKSMLEEFIKHREIVITRRTRFLLKKAKAEAHILEGLLKAIANIDEVIAVIKAAADPASARTELMARFELSEDQARAILQMRLQRLTGLEIEKLEKDLAALREKIAEYESILGDRAKVLALIIGEMDDVETTYNDPRRTQITDEVGDLSIEDLIADEDMVVTVSDAGYVKRMPLTAYKRQRRGGKGITGAGTKTDDYITHVFTASNHDYLCIFTDRGKLYWLKVYDVPELNRYARGRAIVNLVGMGKDEQVAATIPVRNFDDRYVLMATAKGTIKKTVLAAFGRPKRNGIIAQKLDADDSLVGVVLTSGDDDVLLGTRLGMALRFHESDVRPMGRTANGVRGIGLKKDDLVVGLCLAEPGRTVLTICEKGYGKRTEFGEYRKQKRGGKGLINLKVTDRNGPVVRVRNVADGDEILMISEGGMVVRTPVQGISTIGRATQGVRVMAFKKDDDRVAAVALIANEDEAPVEGDAGATDPGDATLPDPEPADADAPDETNETDETGE
jgi:DNA gyrase subunit A